MRVSSSWIWKGEIYWHRPICKRPFFWRKLQFKLHSGYVELVCLSSSLCRRYSLLRNNHGCRTPIETTQCRHGFKIYAIPTPGIAGDIRSGGLQKRRTETWNSSKKTSSKPQDRFSSRSSFLILHLLAFYPSYLKKTSFKDKIEVQFSTPVTTITNRSWFHHARNKYILPYTHHGRIRHAGYDSRTPTQLYWWNPQKNRRSRCIYRTAQSKKSK